MSYVLAIDLGTTGNRVILFDENAKVVMKNYKEFRQIYPKPGWVEHDPKEIVETVRYLLDKTFKEVSLDQIAAIGVTNQRETIVCWNKNTGEPLHNAIVWQDCRTQDYCSELKQDKEIHDYIRTSTGLEIDPYFSGTKIKWLMDNVVKDREDVLFGTVDSWMIWNLAKVHVTDHTNASRTMLYNLNTNKWDERLIEQFGVKENMLPKIVNSSEIVGDYTADGTTIPIAGIAGDQQAALFGQRCFNEGEIKNTYGTGCFCLINTGKQKIASQSGLLTTIGIALNEGIEYALEGSVFIGGAVVQWLRDELGVISSADETEEICKSVEDTNGVYFIPAFAGLGTPYWNTEVRGTVFGLTRGTNKNHLVRAGIESIAYQSKDLMDAMEKDSHEEIPYLNADGGATNNGFLMQFQADILNKKIVIPEVEETTALGAAFLAGIAVGYWKNKDEIKQIDIKGREFVPSMEPEKRDKTVAGWQKYVSQLLK